MDDFDSDDSYEAGYGAPSYGQPGLAELNIDDEAAQQKASEVEQLAAENAAALEQVPDTVKKFVIRLHQALSSGNVNEVQTLYERGWGQLTNEFFKAEEWPRHDVLASLVNNDEVFLTFYRELYFRHLYSRFSQTLDIYDRLDSYENYCNLFNYILNSDSPVAVELPNQWMWDIIDEFIWQFGSYSVWRSKVDDKTEEEINILTEQPHVWSCYSVLNVLYSLIQKSKIQDQLRALRRGEEMESAADEYGAKSIYRMLGYFSLLGLLRVHVLLGDFTLALKVLDDVDLRSMASSSTRLHAVHAAHVSCFYFVGVAYLFMRRYGDAIDTFSRGFAHFHKNRRYTFGSDGVGKVVDRMLALVAFAHALAPAHKLDDWVRQGVTDKHAEAHGRLNRGGDRDALVAAEELLTRACPKFLSPVPPPLPPSDSDELNDSSSFADPMKHLIDLLLTDVIARANLSETRAYLRLYTTLGTAKLADLKGSKEGDVLCDLAIAKGATREVRYRIHPQAIVGETTTQPPPNGLLDGAVETIGDMTFAIDEGMVTVREARRPRQVADYFLRRCTKTLEAVEALRSKPLPVKTVPTVQTAPPPPTDVRGAFAKGGGSGIPKGVRWGGQVKVS